MNKRMQYLIMYVVIFLICWNVGGIVFEGIIAGLLTLASLVFIIESAPVLKWFISKTLFLCDVIIFAFAVYAKAKFGVTIAIGLLFAGLGFSMLYAPYIREVYRIKHGK